MIQVAPRAPAVPSVTPRPPEQVVFAISADLVCSLAGTAERPRINLQPWETFIYGNPPVTAVLVAPCGALTATATATVIPAGPPEGLDAENGDNLMTEAGERMTTEYS